jgi:hypothetical protein
MKWKTRKRRKQEVSERASAPNSMYSYCRVVGCANPARAGTEDGLDRRFCRRHYDLYQRHGSPYTGSYSAQQLDPYRKAALNWLTTNGDDIWARNAIERVNGLYNRAGSAVEAFRLRGLSPRERAWATWARLRKAEIDPRRPVAAWLAIELAIADDPQPVQTVEYKQVQAAKLVHRMASGTHKRWEQAVSSSDTNGRLRKRTVELHVYPRSRGRVLRHIGEDLEKCVELLVEHHLQTIREALSSPPSSTLSQVEN